MFWNLKVSTINITYQQAKLINIEMMITHQSFIIKNYSKLGEATINIIYM